MCDCEECEKRVNFKIKQIIPAQERVFIKISHGENRETYERIFVWAFVKIKSDDDEYEGVYPLISGDAGGKLDIPCFFKYYDILECFGEEDDFNMNLVYNSYNKKR